MDKDIALNVLKDMSSRMYVDYDPFGRKILCIRTDKFEEVRKKYLDGTKPESNAGRI